MVVMVVANQNYVDFGQVLQSKSWGSDPPRAKERIRPCDIRENRIGENIEPL